VPVVRDGNFAFFDMLWLGEAGETEGRGGLSIIGQSPFRSVTLCLGNRHNSDSVVLGLGVELKMNDICIKVLMDPLYRLYVTVIYMNT
jgi:hypothetical protein